LDRQGIPDLTVKLDSPGRLVRLVALEPLVQRAHQDPREIRDRQDRLDRLEQLARLVPLASLESQATLVRLANRVPLEVLVQREIQALKDLRETLEPQDRLVCREPKE